MNQEIVALLKKKEGTVRTGGKGTVRRKKYKKRKVPTGDDKKLQSAIKKLGVNQIPGVEEVAMIHEDGTVRLFKNPKLQASGAARTFIVTGPSEVKNVMDLFPMAQSETNDDGIPELKPGNINFEEVAKDD